MDRDLTTYLLAVGLLSARLIQGDPTDARVERDDRIQPDGRAEPADRVERDARHRGLRHTGD